MPTQTTLTDFARTAITDGGRQYNPDEETVTDTWKGVYLYTSWGYEQTNVNFAQIIEVSDTGNTVVAQLVKTDHVDTSQGSESVRPTPDRYGDEFRLHVRDRDGEPVFRGSYPFVDGEKDTGTRRDSFFPFDNKPEKTVHQTPPNHGH